MFDKVARDLARQYAKKLFGRLGDVASLREGRHGLPLHRYWNYEGYICKFDKFGRAIAAILIMKSQLELSGRSSSRP